MVPETGIEPVRPLFRKAADFKSAVSTNFTTQASADNPLLWQKIRGFGFALSNKCGSQSRKEDLPCCLENKFERLTNCGC